MYNLICFLCNSALSFTIRVGSNKLNSDDPNAITLTTPTYFLHPDYDPATLANDIGLIKLRMPLSYNSIILKYYLHIKINNSKF
jgi:hypothetical protein